jgi:hypothetical protein
VREREKPLFPIKVAELKNIDLIFLLSDCLLNETIDLYAMMGN